MRTILIPGLALVLVLCILIGGCISPSVPSVSVQPTPTPTAILPDVPVPQTSSVQGVRTPLPYSLTPGPTQTVPDYEYVSGTVSRNTITENPTITTTFNGGMGLGMTERMDVTVIRSDGIEESGYRNNPGIGTAVTLMGTTGTDRVIVCLTMTSGDRYTVVDEYYPFPAQL